MKNSNISRMTDLFVWTIKEHNFVCFWGRSISWLYSFLILFFCIVGKIKLFPVGVFLLISGVLGFCVFLYLFIMCRRQHFLFIQKNFPEEAQKAHEAMDNWIRKRKKILGLDR